MQKFTVIAIFESSGTVCAEHMEAKEAMDAAMAWALDHKDEDALVIAVIPGHVSAQYPESMLAEHVSDLVVLSEEQ